MKTEDVTDTLELALQASGLDQAMVMHRPRLLSDDGSSYVSSDLAKWLEQQDMRHTRGASYHPMTQGKIERWHQTLKSRILLENYYLLGDLEADRCIRRGLQPPALPREHRQSHPGRRLLRARSNYPAGTRKDQTQNHPKPPVASPQPSRITSNQDAPDHLLDQAASSGTPRSETRFDLRLREARAEQCTSHTCQDVILNYAVLTIGRTRLTDIEVNGCQSRQHRPPPIGPRCCRICRHVALCRWRRS